jgi:hypothetical protein
MDPWQMALDVMFQSPGSIPAVYISSGPPKLIRVIPGLRQSEVGSVRPRSVAHGTVFDVRKSEIPVASVGDAIIIGETVYTIAVPPEADVEGLTWICDLPELDREISLQRLGTQQNSHGDEQDGFVEVASVHAARLDIGAREETATTGPDRQVNAWRRSVFFVPWSSDVAAVREGDRIVEDGVIYSIESVAEIGTRDGIEITATAKAL